MTDPSNPTAAEFTPESMTQLAARVFLLADVLDRGPTDLAGPELRAILPPRGPSGCTQNRWRAAMLSSLADATFTCGGLTITVDAAG